MKGVLKMPRASVIAAANALAPLFKPLQALAGSRGTSDDSSVGVGELARIP